MKIEAETLLPVMDDMDRLTRIINSGYESGDEIDPVDSGFFLIKKKLEKVLNSAGLERIPCSIGDRFDVNFHEAIGVHDLDDFERYEIGFNEGSVIDVVQHGWTSDGFVVRPSRVIVAQ